MNAAQTIILTAIALLALIGIGLLLRAWRIMHTPAHRYRADRFLFFLPGIAVLQVTLVLILVGALYGFVVA